MRRVEIADKCRVKRRELDWTDLTEPQPVCGCVCMIFMFVFVCLCRLHKYRRVVVNSLDGQAPVSCIFCICVFVSVVFWYLCLCVLSADCVQAKVGQGRVGARVDYLVGQAPPPVAQGHISTRGGYPPRGGNQPPSP